MGIRALLLAAAPGGEASPVLLYFQGFALAVSLWSHSRT